MSKHVQKILMAIFLFSSMLLSAQPKSDAEKVTPASARKKEAEALEKKQGEYDSRMEHHLKSQDKATRKRMKKNLRMARRMSWGKNVPWYKRWFRRK
jgi:hypothetical protein